MNYEQSIGRTNRGDVTKITCRGYKLDTYKVKNAPSTLTKSFIGRDIVYLSCDEPIAIQYDDGRAIMTFQNLGELTVQNKIKLRLSIKFITVFASDFNGALFDLLSNR